MAREVVLTAREVRAEPEVDRELIAGPDWPQRELAAAEVRVVDEQRIGRSMREKPEQQIRDRRVRAVADAQRHHLSRFDDRRRLAAVVEELAADNLHGARSGCRLLPIAGPHVLLDDLEARPLRTYTALEIDGAFAQVRDRLQVVRDEHDRDALALERVHPL